MNQTIICPLCTGEFQRNVIMRKRDLELVRCALCKGIFLDDQKEHPDTAEFYGDNYYRFLKHFSPITDKRLEQLLQEFMPYRGNSRLLDVGCGTGQFLRLAQRAGWDAVGVELSADIAAWAKNELGVHICVGKLEELAFQEASFDVITMFECVEHLTDPFGCLNEVYRLLRPGGLFFMTTPNFNSLTRFFLQQEWTAITDDHLFYFTPRSIDTVLQRAGFYVTRLETKNISIIRIKDKLLRQDNREAKEFVHEREQLRSHMETSPLMRWMKKSVNIGLNITHIGESMKIWAIKGSCNEKKEKDIFPR